MKLKFAARQSACYLAGSDNTSKSGDINTRSVRGRRVCRLRHLITVCSVPWLLLLTVTAYGTADTTETRIIKEMVALEIRLGNRITTEIAALERRVSKQFTELREHTDRSARRVSHEIAEQRQHTDQSVRRVSSEITELRQHTDREIDAVEEKTNRLATTADMWLAVLSLITTMILGFIGIILNQWWMWRLDKNRRR